MTDASLSERLADYICGLSYTDIPKEAVDKLKSVIVHDLVVGLAGVDTEEAGRALDFVRSDIGSSGQSTVIGQSAKASVLDAAFANAVIIRALREEDTLVPSGIHAGALTIPAALAMGEHRCRSGRDVIAALIAGYDVAGKLACPGPRSVTRAVRTPSHVYGAFGVAAVAAKLMDLDREQTATALAYAGNLAAMVTAGFENHQYGVIARNGVTAAYLGRALAPAPRDALEGVPGFFDAQLGGVPPEVESQMATLGVTFEVMTSLLKTFPCSGYNAVAITLFQHLVKEHHVHPDEVAKVTVLRFDTDGNEVVRSHHDSKGPWPSTARAISSVPFALAAVLLDGTVTSGRLAHYDDPAVFEIAQRVEIQRLDGGDFLHKRVEVRTTAGTVLSAEGGPEVLDVPDPIAIARMSRGSIVDADRVAELQTAVSDLEELTSLEDLTRHVAADPNSARTGPASQPQ